jgi:uncharacterized protein (TIGR03086 family)
MEADLAQVHRTAVEGLLANVEKIGDDQWHLPTPNTEWDVRALVEHLVGGTVWVAPLMAGETIAEIGDRYSGDLVGDDPKGAFRRAANEAMAAVEEPGAIERTVDLSRGPSPAADYVLERIADAGMHTWDLARALGIDETIHPDVVRLGRELLARVGDEWRSYGALGPIVPTPAGADEQTLFIAESGRTP